MPDGDLNDERPKITRRRGACRLCREKKVRCNGREPCSLCDRQHVQCSYPLPAYKPLLPPPPQLLPGHTVLSHQSAADSEPVPAAPSPGTSAHLQHGGSVNSVLVSDSLSSVSSGSEHEQRGPPWLDVPYFGSNLDDGSSSLLGYPFEGLQVPAGGDEMLVDPLLLSPPTVSSPAHALDFDMDALDSPEPVAPTFTPVTPVAMGDSLALAMPSTAELPTRRRRRFSVLSSSSSVRRRERLSRILFPPTSESHSASAPSFSAYIPEFSRPRQEASSAAFSASGRMTEQQKFGGKTEKSSVVVGRVAAKLLSRYFLLGLPRSWVNENNSPADGYDDDEACFVLDDLSVLPMAKLVESCFNDSQGAGCFLRDSDILVLMEKHARTDAGEEEQQHDSIPITDVFLLAVIATWGATIDSNEHPGLAPAMVTQILQLRQAVMQKPDSSIKFLALVVMLQYAFKVGLAPFPSILADTVSVAQSLNLHLEAGLVAACADDLARSVSVKRACWVLFCVDKIYAMRWRTFSLLPFVEYDPPPLSSPLKAAPASPQEDWLLLQCRYANICSRISQAFHSISPAGGPSENGEGAHDDDGGDADDTKGMGMRYAEDYNDDSTPRAKTSVGKDLPTKGAHVVAIARDLLAELLAWYNSVPRQESSRHIAVSTAYQYHEAVLAVLGSLDGQLLLPTSSLSSSPSPSSSSSSFSSSGAAFRLPGLIIPDNHYFGIDTNVDTYADAGRSTVGELLLGSIKSVLRLSHHVSDIINDRTLLHVPTLALCTLAVEHVKAVESSSGGSSIWTSPVAKREFRVLFAISYGFFGRLAGTLPHEDFFDRVTELFDSANRY